MVQFVIAGKPDCDAFVHVVHVARYLQEHLPRFKVHVVQKPDEAFESWLQNINEQNKWNHPGSPIIWKELTIRGGIPHYVGGVSEFWEYCYCYYGLQSPTRGETLKKLVNDNLQFYLREREKKKEIKKQVNKIGIFGIQNETLPLLLSELIKLPELQTTGGISVVLYDHFASEELTNDITMDLRCLTEGYCSDFRSVDKLDQLMIDCQLLIILGDYTREEGELEVDWYLRNLSCMYMLADAVNAIVNRNIKIIAALHGPVCFDVNVLVECCTTVRIGNIVGVTSDVGLGAIKRAADFTGVNLANIGGPPVWGYIGVNQFIDVKSAIAYSEMYRPYKRALTSKAGLTLPLGTVHPELRFLSYLIEDANKINIESIESRRKAQKLLNRHLVYSKVRATISVIKLWYAKEPTGDIISLGICSNGSFGIPAGLVFSQPSILKNNGWVPYETFPAMEETKREILKLIDSSEKIHHLMDCVPPTSTNAL